MSKASEWAVKYAALVMSARETQPKVRFASEQDDGSEYVVRAFVSFLKSTGEPALGFVSSRPEHPVGLRAANAVKLAHWILEMFGDATPPTVGSGQSVAAARSPQDASGPTAVAPAPEPRPQEGPTPA